MPYAHSRHSIYIFAKVGTFNLIEVNIELQHQHAQTSSCNLLVWLIDCGLKCIQNIYVVYEIRNGSGVFFPEDTFEIWHVWCHHVLVGCPLDYWMSRLKWGQTWTKFNSLTNCHKDVGNINIDRKTFNGQFWKNHCIQDSLTSNHQPITAEHRAGDAFDHTYPNAVQCDHVHFWTRSRMHFAWSVISHHHKVYL